MFEQVARRAAVLVARSPLPPPIGVVLAVAEAVVLVCTVALEVNDRMGGKGGGRNAKAD